MAGPGQDNSTRSAEPDPHPTPVSGYLGLAIMAFIAVGMVVLQWGAG